MDRINGADTVDIGGGRRGFRDENLETGVPGTEVTAAFLNGLQEEVLQVVTQAGLVPSNGDWTQLWQALQILGLSTGGKSRRWLSVLSMTLSSAPGSPSVGDAYFIPAGASGIWAANAGKIAEWTGASWSYLATPNGHGFSLPDGRIFEKINGAYIELLASETRSGLVELATIPEAKAGSDTSRAVTPAGMAATISDVMPPRQNLCPNAGFEDGLAGISVTSTVSGAGIILASTDWGKCVFISMPPSGNNGTYVIYWPRFAATAGQTYTSSGDAALFAASGTVYYQIRWLDVAGNIIGYSAPKPRGVGDFSQSAAGRQSMAASSIAPAGTAYAQMLCAFVNVENPTLMAARLAKVEFGGLPATAYTPPAPTMQHTTKVYNAAGTYSFTAPVTGWYWVDVYGAGGGGGKAPGGNWGDGGGGGGYAGDTIYLVASTVVTITVGAKGVSSSTGPGATGGTSSFGSYLSATGGIGGNVVTDTPGLGGSGIGGKLNLTGQAGRDGASTFQDLYPAGGDAAGPFGGKGASNPYDATWPGGGGATGFNSSMQSVAAADGGVIISY